MMGYNFGIGGFAGMIVMALFWVAIIVFAIWLVNKLLGNTDRVAMTTDSTSLPLPQPPSASEMLKQRYVRGEITKDQYEEMRRNIEA